MSNKYTKNLKIFSHQWNANQIYDGTLFHLSVYLPSDKQNLTKVGQDEVESAYYEWQNHCTLFIGSSKRF